MSTKGEATGGTALEERSARQRDHQGALRVAVEILGDVARRIADGDLTPLARLSSRPRPRVFRIAETTPQRPAPGPLLDRRADRITTARARDIPRDTPALGPIPDRRADRMTRAVPEDLPLEPPALNPIPLPKTCFTADDKPDPPYLADVDGTSISFNSFHYWDKSIHTDPLKVFTCPA